MNAVISETIKDIELGFPLYAAKFVTRRHQYLSIDLGHAHFNAHMHPQTLKNRNYEREKNRNHERGYSETIKDREFGSIKERKLGF